MKKLLSVIILSTPFWVQGQSSFYEIVELEKHQVGYSDSIIFNEKENYTQFGYSGPAPIFIQIWHPLKENKSGVFLTYGDFRKRELSNELEVVYNNLNRRIDESFISYNIAEEFETYEPIKYGNNSYEQVLGILKETKTKSIAQRISGKSEFPIIIYHHGGQGLPDENFIMAEYFASRGYIFISANYHLPFEGLEYGGSRGVSDLTSFPRKVSAFAEGLTSNDNLFFIGHSWGAQVGLTYLHEDGWASGFVSLETTIEFKKDTAEIKQKWPGVYKVIKTESRKYPIPILLIANTREDAKFSFFENIGKTDVFHVSAKDAFGHESYTSGYLLRYLYNSRFPQPDASIMKSQLTLYNENLKLIESFFNLIQDGEELKREYFKKYFFIN